MGFKEVSAMINFRGRARMVWGWAGGRKDICSDG